MCDLHTHTLHSDGALSPEALVELAHSRGVRTLALTDHDTVDGVDAARARGETLGIDVIAGIELSVRHGGRELHLLGYFVRDPHSLAQPLAAMREARLERAARIVERLHRLGMPVDLSAVRRRAHGRIVGRLHIADEMIHRGYVDDVHAAFDRWLGAGKPAYLERRALSLGEGARLLRSAGAVPVLAHPWASGCDEQLTSLARSGLAGLEVWHPTHDAATVERYREFVRRHGLCATGGSDFHRESPGGILPGDVGVTVEELQRLRDAVEWNGDT